MLTSLKQIYIMLEDINSKRSTDEKINYLKECLDDFIFGKILEKVLLYMINENLYFKLNRVRFIDFFEDNEAVAHQTSDDIFNQLDYFSNKIGELSDEEIAFFEKISSSDPETIEVINNILSKQSRTGLLNEQIKEVLEQRTINR